MKYKILLLSLPMSIFLACSFNSMYLQPTELPEIPPGKERSVSLQKQKMIQHWLSLTLKLCNRLFLKSNKDTINFDFTIESVVFKSSSGNNLNGWLIKPKNLTPTITILHFHGNAGFILSQYQAITPLLNYGFQAFVFDYSGFGFSAGEATRNNVLLDGNSALTYLKSREDVKGTKLVIYGQSLGGHLAAVVAQQRQDDIDALVIEGAFSSHKDIASKTAGIFGRILVSEKYSAFKSIQEYKKPVLVIHSTEDEIIPFKMGQKIFENANAPKEFYEIKKCHICGPEFYADSISQKLLTCSVTSDKRCPERSRRVVS
ncbi:MAG: alpha/beta fold hydrolase [Bacteroidetes bacterium]|nr:alpha/beta fold hydrolase [Bacteroidota bacterium]